MTSCYVLGAERHSRLHTAIGTVTVELLRSSPVPVIVAPLQAQVSQARQKLAGESRAQNAAGSPRALARGRPQRRR
jgi:hypothetical protein